MCLDPVLEHKQPFLFLIPHPPCKETEKERDGEREGEGEREREKERERNVSNLMLMFHQLHMVTRERQKESEVKVSKLVLMCPQLHMATRERQKELMIMFCQHHITTSDSRTKNKESKMRNLTSSFLAFFLSGSFSGALANNATPGNNMDTHHHLKSTHALHRSFSMPTTWTHTLISIHSGFVSFLLHASNMYTHPHLNPLTAHHTILSLHQQHGHTPSSESTYCTPHHSFFTPATWTHTLISIHSGFVSFLLHANNMDTHPHLNPLRLCIIPAPCQQHGHTPSSQSTQALYHSCSMPTWTDTIISIHSCFVSFLLHTSNMDTHHHLNPLTAYHTILSLHQQHVHTPSSQSTCDLDRQSLHTAPFFLYTTTDNKTTHTHKKKKTDGGGVHGDPLRTNSFTDSLF